MWSGSAAAEPPRRSARAGPSPPRPGPGLDLGIWKSGDLEIQKFGIQKSKKIKDLKIQIRSAQNVGKIWISRKKILLAPFGAIPCHFLNGPKKSKEYTKFANFSWWANGPYSPGLGSCAGVVESKKTTEDVILSAYFDVTDCCKPSFMYFVGGAEACQIWPGLAQASIWEFGNLGTWKSRNLGSKQAKK